MSKNIPSDNLAYFERLKEYNDWTDKIRVFNNKTVTAFIVVGILIFIIGQVIDINFLQILGAILIFYYICELVKRDGHKEGYMDGYEAAAQDHRLGLGELDFLNEE